MRERHKHTRHRKAREEGREDRDTETLREKKTWKEKGKRT